jgi:hypothetical protein
VDERTGKIPERTDTTAAGGETGEKIRDSLPKEKRRDSLLEEKRRASLLETTNLDDLIIKDSDTEDRWAFGNSSFTSSGQGEDADHPFPVAADHDTWTSSHNSSFCDGLALVNPCCEK